MSKISRQKKRAKLERKIEAAEIATGFLGKKKDSVLAQSLQKARTEMAVHDARRAKHRYYTTSQRPGEFEKAISVMCQLLDKEAAIKAFLDLFRLAPSREHAVTIAKKLRGASMAEAIFEHVTKHWYRLPGEDPCSCHLCVPEIRVALEAEQQRWCDAHRGSRWRDAIRHGR